MQQPYGLYHDQSRVGQTMPGQQMPASSGYGIQQGMAPGGMSMQHTANMQQNVRPNMQQGQQFAGNMQQFHANRQPVQMQQFPGQMQGFGANIQQFPMNSQQFATHMQPFMRNMQAGMQQIPGNMQQFMAMGGVARGPVPGSMPGMTRGPAPPPYDPQMTKDFKAKQAKMQKEQMKMIEKQKKQMEQEIKHRQFQETQKRLKEFSAMGGRKMDVDSAIHSIIGNPGSETRPSLSHGHTSNPQQLAHSQLYPAASSGSCVRQGGPGTGQLPTQEAPPTDDDFADFKSAPVSQAVSANQTTVNNQVTDLGQDEFADFKSASTPVSGNPNTTNTTTVSHGIQKPADKKKDLMAMMMQCSDLTAPSEPRNLKFKPSVKDIQPSHVKGATFQSSQRARHWSYSEQEQLSDLFTLPAEEQPKTTSPSAKLQPNITLIPSFPTQGGPGHGIPSAGLSPQVPSPTGPSRPALSPSLSAQHKMSPAGSSPINRLQWHEEGSACSMPPVYHMVLEASMRENAIDSNLLSPILLRSGLEKAVLGKLWTLCNQRTPGQLTPHELVLLLAMIAAAQNNVKCDSLDILKNCAYPPIPNLGQHDTTTSQSSVSSASHSAQASSTVTSSPVSHQATPSAFEAPPTLGSISHKTTPTSTTSNAQPSKQEDDFADFQAFSSAPKDDDDFADFKQAPPTIPSAASASDLIGEGDKYAALRLDISLAEPSKEEQSTSKEEFADFASFSDSASNSDNKLTDFSSNTDSNVQSDFSSAAQSVNSDISWSGFSSMTETQSTNQNSVLSFESANNNPESTISIPNPVSSSKQISDDFGDFVSKPVPKTDTNDKLSAIKSLIIDQKLYSEKPKEHKPLTPLHKESPKLGKSKDDDWDPFVGSAGNQGNKAVTSQSDPADLVSPKSSEPNATSEGWADFAGAPEVHNMKADDFGSFHDHGKSVLVPPLSDNMPAPPAKQTENRIKVDPKKAYGIFSHNMKVSRSVPVGMSALDTEPPEIPDFPEDHEQPSNFDKFGTFQSHSEFDLDSHTHGISSLVTPYGGFDDITESSANQSTRKTGNMSESQSASSFEFTGWSNLSKCQKEDSQSMKSLELKHVADSQEGSPNYGDSHSVSSLDLPTEPKKKAQSDTKSIASLELRPESEKEEASDRLKDRPAVEAPPPTEVVPKPKEGKELLTQGGEAPTFGDRYSALFENEPQDSEKHVYAWEKCLNQSKSLIQQASEILNNISSMEVCKEVMESEKGAQYLQSVTEIYRVSCRIKTAMQGLSLDTSKLNSLQRDVHNSWNNLVSFMSSTSLMPSSQSLNFKKALRKDKANNITDFLCGVCLLDVNVASDDSSASEKAGHKLSYGGREYHTTCANFWVNCIDSTLPALKIPELL